MSALPSAAGQYFKRYRRDMLTLPEARQFSKRQTMPERNVVIADEGATGLFQEWPFGSVQTATDRVWTVEDHDWYRDLCAGVQQPKERPGVGVAAGAHIGDIEQHGIEIAELLGRGAHALAVERHDGNAGERIDAIAYCCSIRSFDRESVLRAKQSVDRHAGIPKGQSRVSLRALGRSCRVIGHEPYTLPRGETPPGASRIVEEDVDTESDGHTEKRLGGGAKTADAWT